MWTLQPPLSYTFPHWLLGEGSERRVSVFVEGGCLYVYSVMIAWCMTCTALPRLSLQAHVCQHGSKGKWSLTRWATHTHLDKQAQNKHLYTQNTQLHKHNGTQKCVMKKTYLFLYDNALWKCLKITDLSYLSRLNHSRSYEDIPAGYFFHWIIHK